jgi:DNA-binding MarR family transcriptional regulator
VTGTKVSKADYVALSDFRLALRRYLAFAEQAADQAGIPARQYQAMLVVKGAISGEVPTIGYIADRMLVAPHTALELVNRLRAAGYVEVLIDPADRRRRILSLTHEAELILARLSAVHLQELRELGPRLAQLLTQLSRPKSP